MALYFSADELAKQTLQRVDSARSIYRAAKSVAKSVRIDRQQGQQEAAIETRVTSRYSDVAALIAELEADLAATRAALLHQVEVEVGRPATYTDAHLTGPSSKATASWGAIAPAGTDVFNEIDTADIVEIRHNGTLLGGFTVLADQNIVSNGTFGVATDWAFGAGWAHNAGTFAVDATTSDASLSQSVTDNPIMAGLRDGNVVTVSYTVSNYSVGTVTPFIGGNTGTAESSNGAKSEDITLTTPLLPAASLELGFTGAGFTGTIDAVQIVPKSWLFVNPSFLALDIIELNQKKVVVTLKER